ncbi:MAG: metallophosphoesterase [Phycisphaerae bacterium]|nr:metallophosphoesterase [Phycisphaerae bacterium]
MNDPATNSAPSQDDDARTLKRGKYQRAKMRHLLFTITADRLTRGLLLRRHIAQSVETREVELLVAGWPAAFDGLRIAHISDFHVGHLMSAERAIEIIVAVSAAKPDLIACTGDVVDLDADCGVDRVFEAIAACQAPLGSWLVLGNHDHLDHPRRLVRTAKSHGIGVLHEDVVTIRPKGGPPDQMLRIGGIDWGRTIKECSQKVGRTWRVGGGVDLLLAHNPKAFVGAAWLGIPLTLAGHTHGGQVALRRRQQSDVSFARRLRAGIYRRAESTLFVTVGLGAWFPLRYNCPPELVMLTVRRTER